MNACAIHALMPSALPAGWEEVDFPLVAGPTGRRYLRERDGLSVICTVDEAPPASWLHVSVAHPKRYPTWDEIVFVKETFMGRDRDAVQILPRREDWVNLHPNCFHLWSNLDGETVPGNPHRC